MARTFVRSTSREGSALVTVMVPLLGALILGYAFFRSTLADQASAHGDQDERQAFFLAEAGLHEAFQSLRAGNSGAVATADAPALLGGGVLWVEAADLGNDRKQLTSTSMFGTGRCALETVVHMEPEKPPLFVATLNSKDTLTCNADVMIDSYDSAVGSYLSQATQSGHGYTYAHANGDVRSNQDVILNARATVFGDAVPGPGHGVSFATDSWVSGEIVPAPAPFVFPPIAFPGIAPSGTAYSVPAAGSKVLGPGNYNFNSFTLNKDARLKINGPATIEVMGDFYGGKTAQLNIDAKNGPVTFYVHGNYTHIAGFEAAPVSSSPMALAFMVNGTSGITFPSATKIRGAYYTPNANITFASGNECWGAFAANKIAMSNSMHFHFDETLMRYWQGQSGNNGDPLSVLAWRKTAVLPSSLVADRRDPMLVLGLDPSKLNAPGQSWQP